MKIGILFDLDGTLIDSLEDLTDSVNYVMDLYNCPRHTLAEVRSFVGTGAKNLIRKALPGLPTDPPVDEVLEKYRAHYEKNSHNKTRPYDGILCALNAVRRKYPVAIVSNKPDKAVKALCKSFFGQDVYALGEEPPVPRKPAPDMVLKAMADIGVDKCIYVGDSDIDVQTAQNSGVSVLSVLWGFRDKKDLLAVGATHFCDDPALLADAIDEIVKEQFGDGK